MSIELRANTAVDVLIGPFVDITDANSTEDGLSASLTSAATKLSKNGQTLESRNDVTDCAFDDDGYYNCELDATDTNTEGSLVLIAHIAATALPVRHEYNVLSEAAWDSKYFAKDTGFMDVNIKAVSEDTTAADNLELACDNYSVTRGLTGTAVPAVAADGAFGLPISDAGGLDLDTKLANTNEVTVARMGALTDWIDAGRLDAILDLILADTGELQTDDVPTLIAAVQSDTDDLQTQIGTAGAGLTNLGGSGNDWNTVVPDAAGVAPTTGEIATAIWDAAQSSHVIVDSMGAMATELALIPTKAEMDTAHGLLSTFDPTTDEVDMGKINGTTIVGDGVSPKFGV